jgi:hypothetical protein
LIPFKVLIEHLRQQSSTLFPARRGYHIQQVNEICFKMPSDHMLSVEKLWEIHIQQKELELNYARDQLLLKRKDREAREEVARLNEDLSHQVPPGGEHSKTSFGKERVKEPQEDLIPGVLDDLNAFQQLEQTSTQSTKHHTRIATASSRPGTKSNEMKDETEQQPISTVPESLPRPGAVVVKLPVGSKVTTNAHNSTQQKKVDGDKPPQEISEQTKPNNN